MKTVFVSLVLLLASAATLSAQTPDQNKAKAAEFYQAFNSGDLTRFNAGNFIAADFVDYSVPIETWTQMGADGVTRFQTILQLYQGAFDFHFKPSLFVAEGEYVMVYGEASGHFRQDFMGIKANGKSFKFQDVDIIRFNAAGLAIGHWTVQDPSVMWAQLGVEPK